MRVTVSFLGLLVGSIGAPLWEHAGKKNEPPVAGYGASRAHPLPRDDAG